jgi:hypothetical protein
VHDDFLFGDFAYLYPWGENATGHQDQHR